MDGGIARTKDEYLFRTGLNTVMTLIWAGASFAMAGQREPWTILCLLGLLIHLMTAAFYWRRWRTYDKKRPE